MQEGRGGRKGRGKEGGTEGGREKSIENKEKRREMRDGAGWRKTGRAQHKVMPEKMYNKHL